jgi:hypothetical protein
MERWRARTSECRRRSRDDVLGVGTVGDGARRADGDAARLEHLWSVRAPFDGEVGWEVALAMRSCEYWTTGGQAGADDRIALWQDMLSATHLPWTV